MMPLLSDRDRARLLRCLELLDRGATPGERDAAACAVRRIKHSLKFSWKDIIVDGAATYAAPAPPYEPIIGWQQKVAKCLERQERLTGWELSFLRGLADFHTLSSKQEQCVINIYCKVFGRGRRRT